MISGISKLAWGEQGVVEAANHGDVVVVVDTLRFSTTVASAISHGAAIYPCLESEDVDAVAQRIRGIAARKQASGPGYSLSPQAFANVPPGTRIALASLNGAACSRHRRGTGALLTGSLVNASATAREAVRISNQLGSKITVVACGEKMVGTNGDQYLRKAIEDYLGAGAILSNIAGNATMETASCVAAFRSCQTHLSKILWESESGQELRARGNDEDVRFAAMLDTIQCAAIFSNGYFLTPIMS